MGTQKKTLKEARKKIIEAALDLFSQKGFYATTTRKIAQQADVSEVTLFRHFKSKTALFQEVLKEIKNLGFDADTVEGVDLSPEDAIRFSVQAALETIEAHPTELRLLNLALLDGVEGFEEEFVDKNTKQAVKFISEAFKKLQHKGSVSSEESPELLAELLLSVVSDVATQRVIRKNSTLKHYDRDVLAKAIINLFI